MKSFVFYVGQIFIQNIIPNTINYQNYCPKKTNNPKYIFYYIPHSEFHFVSMNSIDPYIYICKRRIHIIAYPVIKNRKWIPCDIIERIPIIHNDNNFLLCHTNAFKIICHIIKRHVKDGTWIDFLFSIMDNGVHMKVNQSMYIKGK